MSKAKIDRSQLSPQTRLTSAARDYCQHGSVSPPVYHVSTYLFPTMADFRRTWHDHADGKNAYAYGRRGTPTSRALEEAVAEMEGGYAAKAAPSGLAAITSVLLAFLKSGDHLLVTDSVYGPVRHFCDTLLAGYGVETTYYDPLIGAGISALMRPSTRMVFCETPGSQTMEMQDLPAIAAAAHARGALVVTDNTWAAGYLFNPFAHGADISVQAATKYICGHADTMLGIATCNERTWPQFRDAFETLGLFAGADDMAAALRGLRTLHVRLKQHMEGALRVAHWLKARPEVADVLYPALPDSPGHQLWKRDFTGASGLLSVVLKPASKERVTAFVDTLQLFSIGESWGGFESLVIPFTPRRTATRWTAPGPCLRLNVGLESADDLIADLGEGFKAMAAAT